MANPAHTAANWHKTPQARALIARLTPDNVETRRCMGVPDFTILIGKTDAAHNTLTALDLLHETAPEIELGFSYASTQRPFRPAMAEQYLNCLATARSVLDVVIEAFAARAERAAA